MDKEERHSRTEGLILQWKKKAMRMRERGHQLKYFHVCVTETAQLKTAQLMNECLYNLI
jgi:hypothetical protein